MFTRYNNRIMRRALNITLLILLVMTLFFTVEITPVHAQVGSASDLINGVNSLRQSQGLAPYTVSSYLMSFAQSHSDYMATLGTWTHVRADGTTAFDHGIKENVAMGTNMSIDYCIYTVWSDWDHWKTMVSYAGGTVGAGVTVADSTVYYTLNVLPDDSAVINNPDNNDDTGEAVPVSQDTEVPYNPVMTVTPDQDGIIIHIVKYGEALSTIAQAYGVSIGQILTNSGLPSTTTNIYEGQTLIIQTATEPSATPTNTPTQNPGTPTPTQVRPTLTPHPTRTSAPTYTPTSPPSIVHRALGNGKNVGLGLILICGVGLVLVLYLGFLKKS